MKTAVVFYSLEGNTKLLAEKIAEKLGAKLIEIAPEKPYPTSGAKKFFFGGKDSSFKEKPALSPYEFNVGDFDAVVIGAPLWAWNIAPPMRTFLSENDLSKKRVAAFISCGGGNTKKAFANINALLGENELIAELSVTDPLKAPASDIDIKLDDFCDKIKYIPN